MTYGWLTTSQDCFYFVLDRDRRMVGKYETFDEALAAKPFGGCVMRHGHRVD